jgi:hypothetical protein
MDWPGIEIISGKANSGKTARLARTARDFMEAGGYCLYLDLDNGPLAGLGRIMQPYVVRPDWLVDRLIMPMEPGEELELLLDRPEKSILAKMTKENPNRKILVCIDGIWYAKSEKSLDERLDWLAAIHKANANVTFAVTYQINQP